MLMSLTTAFRSRRPEASRSATSVVAIPILPFLREPAYNTTGRDKFGGGKPSIIRERQRGGQPKSPIRSPCTSFETRLPHGRTAPCCGTYYIVPRAIPAPE